MTQTAIHSNGDNKRRLDAVLPLYERLRTEQIRAQGDLERCQTEVQAAEQEAITALGTADEAELEALLAKAEAQDSDLVGEFEATVRKVADDLAALR